MTRDIQRAINSNDESVPSEITLNSSTSTIISTAKIGIDKRPERINFIFSNTSSKLVWLKFQAASIDNNKTGIAVFPRTNYEMSTDNIYKGEISAIADSGSPVVNVEEF